MKDAIGVVAMAGSLLRIIQTLSKIPSPGPQPGFTYVHVCRAILAVGDEGPIGRIELSRKLCLGEGTVRTIIKHLVQAKLLTTVSDGCILTKRGTALHAQLRENLSKISLINAKQLALDKINVAVTVRGAGQRVKKGIEQRDAAVRAGATGACTLVARGREYLMPMAEKDDWRLKADDQLTLRLWETLQPKEGDVIVIVGAPEKALAEYGALAAAMTLLE